MKKTKYFSNFLLTNKIKYYILSRLTKKYILRGVAQLVARHIWDVDAAGSTPVTPTKGFPIGSPFSFFSKLKYYESNLMEVFALKSVFKIYNGKTIVYWVYKITMLATCYNLKTVAFYFVGGIIILTKELFS